MPRENELPGHSGFGRSNRALGRGLEDISHLFLSGQRATSPLYGACSRSGPTSGGTAVLFEQVCDLDQ